MEVKHTMATKKKVGTSTKRSRSAPGSTKKKGKRRTSYKNKSISGDVASAGLLVGVLASPVTGKVIDAVRSRSVQPLANWNKAEVIRTGVTVGGGYVGGKVLGNVLNKVKPVKLVVNKAKKLVKGMI